MDMLQATKLPLWLLLLVACGALPTAQSQSNPNFAPCDGDFPGMHCGSPRAQMNFGGEIPFCYCNVECVQNGTCCPHYERSCGAFPTSSPTPSPTLSPTTSAPTLSPEMTARVYACCRGLAYAASNYQSTRARSCAARRDGESPNDCMEHWDWARRSGCEYWNQCEERITAFPTASPTYSPTYFPTSSVTNPPTNLPTSPMANQPTSWQEPLTNPPTMPSRTYPPTYPPNTFERSAGIFRSGSNLEISSPAGGNISLTAAAVNLNGQDLISEMVALRAENSAQAAAIDAQATIIDGLLLRMAALEATTTPSPTVPGPTAAPVSPPMY